MAMKVIRSKFDAECRECGSFLPAGSEIRYYGRGKVYGVHCHPDTRKGRSKDYSIYNGRGERIGSSCGCEDYPCCGH